MSARLPTALALVMVSLSFARVADADAVRPPDQVSRPVALAGIDPSTPAGIAAAQARIADAARRLCRRFEDSRRVSSRATYADCVRDTRAAALHQRELQVPAAFAGYPSSR
jgi:UrcA family protein